LKHQSVKEIPQKVMVILNCNPEAALALALLNYKFRHMPGSYLILKSKIINVSILSSTISEV